MAAATECGLLKAALVWASAPVMIAASTCPTWAESEFLRGEALYRNHCVACHTCKAHSRQAPSVKNRDELAREVDRWQANLRLGWKPEDRGAVVDYLDSAFYKF